MLKILAVNFATREGDVEGNVNRAEALIRNFVRHSEVDLVILPELFTCGYCGASLSTWSEDTESKTFKVFGALAQEIDAIIGWGFSERAHDHFAYNCFALIEPGRPALLVRKTHLHMSTQGTRQNEPEYLLPGDKLGLIDTRVGRLGVMICYDGCFVEVPRSLVLQGAECILWPTRSGSYLAGTGFPRIRAIDNIVPIVMVEGSQTGGDFPLHSHSQILDHKGNVLAECKDDEGILYTAIDLSASSYFRETALDAWAQYRVRRPELYGPITSKTNAATEE